MRRQFFSMAVALCGLTAQPGLSIDLQKVGSSCDVTPNLTSDNGSGFTQAMSWLPQCEAESSLPQIVPEPHDTLTTDQESSTMLAAQVGASRMFID